MQRHLEVVFFNTTLVM